MLLQSEALYVYTAVIHDMMDISNATYVTIWTINTITITYCLIVSITCICYLRLTLYIFFMH